MTTGEIVPMITQMMLLLNALQAAPSPNHPRVVRQPHEVFLGVAPFQFVKLR